LEEQNQTFAQVQRCYCISGFIVRGSKSIFGDSWGD
jgi:hypothetical protein